ncbi:MAG: ABC transporter ATP-binding protein [Gemmatimonadota bacterium]
MSSRAGIPLVSIRGLRHTFRIRGERGERTEVQALRGVDLDLFPGECLALVGESGAGKTTLARAILRLVQPTAGKIVFKGRDVSTFSPKQLRGFRREAQIVFQDPFGALNPRLRAGRMLEEVLKVHGRGATPAVRRERALELLRMVGLSQDAFHRFPHEFSGGQRQRLGIARALSVEPELLVLDEPVSALDLSVQAQILNLLQELQEALGLTCLLVAHDLSVVRQVADRVGVFYLGEVVAVGPAMEVLAEPLHPYTRGLLAAASPTALQGNVGGHPPLLPGDPPSPVDPPRGCALFPRCPHPLKDAKCRQENPPLERVGRNRRAACWKLGAQVVRP